MKMTADKLRRWREKNKLTRDELAAKCGMSARTIEGYELGRPIPEYMFRFMVLYNKMRRR